MKGMGGGGAWINTEESSRGIQDSSQHLKFGFVQGCTFCNFGRVSILKIKSEEIVDGNGNHVFSKKFTIKFAVHHRQVKVSGGYV